MPLLARMLLSPLFIDIRAGAVTGLGELLSDRRISSEGHVAVAVGPGQGEQLVGQIGPALDNADIFTVSANLTGLPSISVPCGFSASRLPIGFQLTGRAFDEATLLRAADAYQRDTSFHTEQPPTT